jgi:hypothetical protein
MSMKTFFGPFVFIIISLCISCSHIDADEPMARDTSASANPTAVASPAEAPADAPNEKAASALTVGKAVICTDIMERNPVGEGTLFPASVEKLYCHSLILGAEEETTIHHVWYWENQQMADIALDIRSPRFRTNSSKRILSEWKGTWRVELIGPDGEILDTVAFNVE